MAKTANLYARIEPELKAEAEAILAELGIPVSSAINMFYKQIVLQRGLPFDLRLPPCIDDLTPEELMAEIQKGIDSARRGPCYSVEEVFKEVNERFGL
ncbi:MAG: type II toxin-antitoxin system RelB/DinJ family antitoxin [Clostridiales bacterium]|nr:type II toxin-antitoxin system RelB/DinJ family antitoxin [Clostridiales bacterium]